MVQATIKTRQATPARWQAALARAFADGLRLYRAADTGAAFVTSGSDDSMIYATNGVSCSCAAAVLGNDPVCRHRALYWFDRGMLEPEPEPPTPAAPALAIVAPVVRCAVCRDTGRVTKPSIWFAGQTMEGFCPNCTPHYDFATRRFIKVAA